MPLPSPKSTSTSNGIPFEITAKLHVNSLFLVTMNGQFMLIVDVEAEIKMNIVKCE
jgi:hypothetical protein